jgi:hypothetical protein
MLHRRLRNITLGLYGRLFLSRCMQVRARRKTGVMLREYNLPVADRRLVTFSCLAKKK